MRENRNALIAAAVIMAAFILVAFFLPDIMMAAGSYSPIAAAIVAIAFVAAFFLVFWLRGRSRNGS